MNLQKLIYLVRLNLAERKGRTFTATFVVAFAVAVVMLVLSLSFGFLRDIVRKAEEAYPPGMLVVKPRTMNVAMLAVNTTNMTQETVDNIRKLPGVDYVAPQLSLKMPMRAEAEVLGQYAQSDAFVIGIDPSVLKQDIAPGYVFDADPTTSGVIPCVVPRYFLDMYNLAYSESMSLPKVNEEFAIGKHVQLFLGESYTGGTSPGKQRQVTLQIIGLTPSPNFVGVLIPLKVAEALNEWYTGSKDQPYTALHVSMKELQKIDEVTSRIEAMNLRVESQKETFEKFQFVAGAVQVLTAVFGIVVMIIAAVSIFNTFALIMSQRRGEVGVLRAVGGSRNVVTLIFVVEVLLIGVVGAFIGTLASWAMLAWAQSRILAALPNVTFLPERVFSFDPQVVGGALLLGIVLSLAATLPTIMRTTRQSPVSLISEN